jgi:alkanesulfonate monooxygenase SsuD/methylene tetrahydromethanopterin reductase-like flavin-dependent oxidoreductase (luciferase family)
MKRGLYLAPFDELADPRLLAEPARETVTVVHLSNGRLTLGVGLGMGDDLEPFGEAADPRDRGRLLDEGLDRLGRFWSGGFRLLPRQRPRIPVWVAGGWPNRRPVRRAVRWDGRFPIDPPGPEGLAELAEEVRRARAGSDAPFGLVLAAPPGADVHPWEAAGATWVLTSIDPQPPEPEVRAVVDAGP